MRVEIAKLENFPELRKWMRKEEEVYGFGASMTVGSCNFVA